MADRAENTSWDLEQPTFRELTLAFAEPQDAAALRRVGVLVYDAILESAGVCLDPGPHLRGLAEDLDVAARFLASYLADFNTPGVRNAVEDWRARLVELAGEIRDAADV